MDQRERNPFRRMYFSSQLQDVSRKSAVFDQQRLGAKNYLKSHRPFLLGLT